MEINVIESTKNRLKFELVGKTHTLANIVVKELWQDKNVEYAGYTVKHPQISHAILVVENKKGDPKKVLLDAISRLEKENKAFIEKIKKVLK